jgi:hypothetical protein
MIKPPACKVPASSKIQDHTPTRHDYPPTATQNTNPILEPTSTQLKTIDDINTAITTANITLQSPIPHQAHRIERARTQ